MGILLLATLTALRAAEPSFQGKTVGDWLVLLNKGDDSAEAAIRQLGTNCLPTLLDMLGATEATRKKVASRSGSSELKSLTSRGVISSGDLQDMAMQGFRVLGTNAEPAVPKLAKLLHGEETAESAGQVLLGTGPKGLSVLTNAMNDGALTHVMIQVFANYKGSETEMVTSLLLRAVKDPNPAVQGNAADALAGRNPEVAVPVLIELLGNPDPYPKLRAVITLARYGPAAKRAIPKLMEYYTNNWDSFAFHALRTIDPDAGAEAERYQLARGPLNDARGSYTQTRLANGKELIAGGIVHTQYPAEKAVILNTSQLRDPVNGRWTEAGVMNVPRWGHTAVLLADGRVLVVGGVCALPIGKPGAIVASCEIFDPSKGSWTNTGSLHAARYDAKADLRPDGKVMVSGGKNYDIVEIWELYDPIKGTWSILESK